MNVKAREAATAATVVALVLGLGACRRKEQASTGPSAAAVRVADVRRGTIRETLSATGMIAARKEAKLSFKAPGRIETIAVAAGQEVRKGDVLARLDQSDFLAGLRQAEAGLETARAGIAQAEAQVALARVALRRMKGLYADESIPKSQLDDVQAKSDMAAAGLMAAKAQEGQAAAGLEAARNQLSNTVLRAPFDGVVASKFGSVGETVGPGVPILVLADLTAAIAKFDLPESAYGKVRVGTRVDIRVDSYAGRPPFAGRVTTKAPAVDPRSRKFALEVEIPNADEDHKLVSGMFARIEVVTAERSEALLVPVRALVGQGNPGEVTVFVVEDNRARPRDIRTGLRDGENVEVISGLEAGEPVIVDGNIGLTDGSAIKVMR